LGAGTIEQRDTEALARRVASEIAAHHRETENADIGKLGHRIHHILKSRAANAATLPSPLKRSKPHLCIQLCGLGDLSKDLGGGRTFGARSQPRYRERASRAACSSATPTTATRPSAAYAITGDATGFASALATVLRALGNRKYYSCDLSVET